MQEVGVMLQSLTDDAARRRVATWIFQKYAEDIPARHAEVDGDGQAATRHASAGTVKEFISTNRPARKSDRLLLLVKWANLHADSAPSVQTLNALNREAAGEAFSEAASIAQALVRGGLLIRPEPGHLRLSPAGERFVRSIQRQ
jgi:hypothetical protein